MAADFSTPDPAPLSSVGPPVPPPTEMPSPAIEGYEILGVLGKGGMGIVYKAKQTAPNRIVALKMILGGFADEQARARFRTEAQAVAAMQHPNIVQIFDVDADSNEPFFSLEFCSGGSLEDRLKPSPLPPTEAAGLVGTLARAMHHAHERRVVHRDLKPANVLLTEDGTPKITDFGLAKRLDDIGRSGTTAVVGTPSYMAPEQTTGELKGIGPATDVYALGAILYECLTGRPPFKAAKIVDTLIQVLNDDPVPPRQLQPKTPRDLETICLKCLQKDPKRRYSGADVLAEDLRRFQAHEPITARPVGFLERSWRWCRRKPKDAALVAAGLLALALGAFAYLWIAGARQAADQDRRDHQARATTQAERSVAEADLLWDQAKTAPVEDLLPWEQALAAAARAKQVIDGNAVDEPTRRHVEKTLAGVAAAKQEAETRKWQAERDGRMKVELQKLALTQLQMTKVGGKAKLDRALGDKQYEQAFRDYGIDLGRIADAEARMRGSAIKAELIAALDAWIPWRIDEAARRQLADLANAVSDPDDGFRRELREAVVKGDVARLRVLAKRDVSALPPAVLFETGFMLCNDQAFEEAVALLRSAQKRYRGDFSINLLLASCLREIGPLDRDEARGANLDEARGYATAAAALQPENGPALVVLADILVEQGNLDDAITAYQAAIQQDPTLAPAHFGLGVVLAERGRIEEATGELRTAIAEGLPTLGLAHFYLGLALDAQGKRDDAVSELQAAKQLEPMNPEIHYQLGMALIQSGQFAPAVMEFHKARDLFSPMDQQREDAIQQARTALNVMNLENKVLNMSKEQSKPRDVTEAFEFARYFEWKSRYVTSARLYAEVMSESPSLAAKPNLRFFAAEVTALAGCGRGADAGELKPGEDVRFRERALIWMRAEFADWTRQAESEKADDRLAAAKRLRIWQCHVAFVGVRDEAELKKLPPEEQAEWRKFWTDVQAAVERAEKQ